MEKPIEIDKTMEPDCKLILNHVGIYFNSIAELEGIFFPRDQLLSETKYEVIKQ